jgi:hypothetical protein
MRIINPLRALAAAIVFIVAFPAIAQAQVYVGFNIGVPPPPLPVYQQPYAPAPNYMWEPGYWAWGQAGYYWVPGTWVQPPQTGMYWTPGYWGANTGGTAFGWNTGYWGPQVGFYGGVPYGGGYVGTGFYGGQWTPGGFSYNTAYSNVNPSITRNVYINRTVINRTVINRTSYNGGPHGIAVRPTAAQEALAREHHIAMTQAQINHERAAAANRENLASVNHGKPPVAAVPKPLDKPEVGAKPPTDADKAEAKSHIVAAPKAEPKAAAKPAEASKPKEAPPAHVTAPVHAAPAHAAPAHAAPAHAAPAHAAPVHAAAHPAPKAPPAHPAAQKPPAKPAEHPAGDDKKPPHN